MKVSALFVICLLAIKVNGFMELNRRCGEKLSQILWIVCENGFNNMMQKRSDVSSIDDVALHPYASFSLANIFQLDAENLLAKTRRIRMLGIVDECCKKSCSLNELSGYCN